MPLAHVVINESTTVRDILKFYERLLSEHPKHRQYMECLCCKLLKGGVDIPTAEQAAQVALDTSAKHKDLMGLTASEFEAWNIVGLGSSILVQLAIVKERM